MSDGHPERYFEDFSLGLRFRSAEVTVTAEDIKRFAREFDPQPFHTDEAAAKASFFGELVASGWHTAALSMRMLADSDLRPAGGSIGAGVEDLRWPRPTHAGDVLHLEGEVIDLRPSRSRPTIGIVKIRVETLNQRGDLVQEFTPALIVPRRPSRA
jgi:acyl dehydratase